MRVQDNGKEYLMMREEILQYLNEYQLVRNMMYLITATTLGFGIKDGNFNLAYLFLLPLIVILPSYIVSINYWEGVVKASTYLMVFLELNRECRFRWESRHYLLNKEYKNTPKINVHIIPYLVCTVMCIILYFANINYKNILDIMIGIVVLIISIFVFFYYKCVDNEWYLERWMKVKQDGDKKFVEFIKNMDK